MFNRLDHRMTMPGADKCFFLQVDEWVGALRQDLIDDSPIVLDRLELIMQALDDFKAGNDPRTLE